MTDAQVYAGAAVIGLVAGMRSMSAPAIVSKVDSGDGATEGGISGFFASPLAGTTMTVLAAAEGIADKLPFVPARTKTGSVIVRAISGGLSGAAICAAKKRSPIPGAIFGALGAVAATYAAYELRKRAGEKFHLPDKVVAIVEDAIVAGAASLLISRLRSEEPSAA